MVPSPEDVENHLRSLLPLGQPALNREDAIRLLRRLKAAVEELRALARLGAACTPLRALVLLDVLDGYRAVITTARSSNRSLSLGYPGCGYHPTTDPADEPPYASRS